MFGFIEKLGAGDALRRIYTGEDALQKHMWLFLLVAIPAMLTTPLNQASKHLVLTNAQFCLALFGLLIIAVMSIYITGYLYGVMHNSFVESDESILPKFDTSWFRVFFKGFPVQLTWFCYLAIIFVVTAIVVALLGGLVLPYTVRAISAISISVAFLVINVFILSLPFVYSQFAENYDRKGLYNPILPIKYMCKAFKSFITLLLVFAPAFVVIAIIGYFGTKDNVFAYLLTAVWAYLWTIMQYSANYCYIKIYKEQIRG